MSDKIEWSEDSAQTIIERDFFEQAEGDLAEIKIWRKDDNVFEVFTVIADHVIGLPRVAQALHPEPLEAARVALGRTVAQINLMKAEMAADEEADRGL